jgi:hypothetical protein
LDGEKWEEIMKLLIVLGLLLVMGCSSAPKRPEPFTPEWYKLEQKAVRNSIDEMLYQNYLDYERSKIKTAENK